MSVEVYEVILERVINDVTMQCGYVRPTGSEEFKPYINISGVVTLFEDITKARSAFWANVNR